ncbi:MAG: amino acid ABC transporter substrate-binding protein [Chloroflexi bacterium]|nr:amino acid ABC transporter substrate-binding protein [Chloroflexota bacterium]
MTKTSIRTSILAMLVLLSLSACTQPEDATWTSVQNSGVLRVGMDAAYPPFEVINAESGAFEGFDVDLALEIGERLGLEIAFTNISFDGLYDALLTNQVDVVISALPVLDDVQGRALFTLPYFNNGDRLVMPVGADFVTMSDLEGRTLAVELGSGGDVEGRLWERRLRDLNIYRYNTPAEALQAVAEGQADAALVDAISARLGVGQNPDLALGEHVNEILFAGAVHPNSRRLKAQLDAVLNEMLRDGTVDALLERWFGPQREVETSGAHPLARPYTVSLAH